MESIVICSSGGIGDQIEGLKCASYIPDYANKVKVYSCSRNEVFSPLHHLFGQKFKLEQIPEKYAEDYQILHNTSLVNDLKGNASEFYFITPDLLYRGPYAFDYKKYNVLLPTIKSTRLLLDKLIPKNEIYLGLMSTTPGYLYEEIVCLAIGLANSLPDYLIHLPIITNWANQEIIIPGFPILSKPENLLVYYNPNFIEQLEIQKKCCYGIYTDNGMNHLAHHFGQSKISLDPHNFHSLWMSRWHECNNEWIDIKTSAKEIIKLCMTHLIIPQTTLLPHKHVLDIIIHDAILGAETRWDWELGFKF